MTGPSCASGWVNWADVASGVLQFRGTLGEIERGAGFRAELRGLSEALNQPQGRVFQAACTAVLGDARCRVDLRSRAMAVESGVIEVGGRADVPASPRLPGSTTAGSSGGG
jgi:uncharacterized phage protein (TIGR02218 family)